MKLRIKSKLMSVHSEVEVLDRSGEVVYHADTDPLSSPRLTRYKDAGHNELAVITTVRLDSENRAHHVVMADGRTFDLKRKFRTPASTTESYLTVSGAGWKIVTRRAWTSRFEIRSESGSVMLEAKQVPAERGDTYDLDVHDEEHVDELVLLSLIARYVMREDAPVPAAI